MSEKKQPPASLASAATGKRGESAAARYLESRGCRVVARNWRANPGEIDIVALCPSLSTSTSPAASPYGSGAAGEYAFIEVRTRHGREGLAEESISTRKAAGMIGAAYAYMAAHGIDPDSAHWRIDIVAVAITPAGQVRVNWIKGALDEGMAENT